MVKKEVVRRMVPSAWSPQAREEQITGRRAQIQPPPPFSAATRRIKPPTNPLRPGTVRHTTACCQNLPLLEVDMFVGCAGAGAGADDADSMGRPAAASPGRHRSAPPKTLVENLVANTCRKPCTLELTMMRWVLWCAASAFGCGPPSSRRPATRSD